MQSAIASPSSLCQRGRGEDDQGQRWGWPRAEWTEKFPHGLGHFPPPLHSLTQGLPFHMSSPAPVFLQCFHRGDCHLLQAGFSCCFSINCSSVVTCSFGRLNCFHLWFPNASGAARYFPSSAPFTASPLPLPLSVFWRLSSFIAPFLLFQLIPWQSNSFSWLFLPSLGGWLPSLSFCSWQHLSFLSLGFSDFTPQVYPTCNCQHFLASLHCNFLTI